MIVGVLGIGTDSTVLIPASTFSGVRSSVERHEEANNATAREDMVFIMKFSLNQLSDQ